jgi:hypothetical protein
MVKSMKAKSIKHDRAVDLMRAGARLCLMHNNDGFIYYVVPGGPVTTETAEKIKQHPLVRAGRDGLLPGHDQTSAMEPAA